MDRSTRNIATDVVTEMMIAYSIEVSPVVSLWLGSSLCRSRNVSTITGISDEIAMMATTVNGMGVEIRSVGCCLR